MMKMITSSLLERCIQLGGQILRHKSMQVTVCGAAGKVGQTLSLLLKQSKVIDRLVLYDVHQVRGIAAELNHVDIKCDISSEAGDLQLSTALEKTDVVVIVANASKVSDPSNPTMFKTNAVVVKQIMEVFAKVCPNAILIMATNPINSLVPLASEILKANKVLNVQKVFGATSLNVIRTNAIVAKTLCLVPENVSVPVVGGHVGRSVVPILSHTKPQSKFTKEQLDKITKQVQSAHLDVIALRNNNECAYLSCAFALAKFITSIVKGLKGAPNIVEHAYVRSNAHPHAKYFTSPLLLGKNGYEKDLGLPKIVTEYETCQIEHAVSLVMKDIRTGERYGGKEQPKPCDPCSSDNPCPPTFCQGV